MSPDNQPGGYFDPADTNKAMCSGCGLWIDLGPGDDDPLIRHKNKCRAYGSFNDDDHDDWERLRRDGAFDGVGEGE